MAQKLNIVVNKQVCSGCHLCEMVCGLFHERVVNLEKARCRVTDNYQELLYEPHVCQLCESPACVDACPMTALTQDVGTGVVAVDQKLCNGCEACVEACPHQAIWWRNELERLFVCDRCGGQPTCVQFCTDGALQFAGAGKREDSSQRIGV